MAIDDTFIIKASQKLYNGQKGVKWGIVMQAKEKLKRAFKEIFVTKPIQKITVTELAQAADVNRKTFYRYFYTMDDVLSAVEKDLLNDLTQQIKGVSPFSIHNFLLALNELVKKNQRFYQSLIRQQKNSFFLNDAERILKAGLAQKLGLGKRNVKEDFQLEFIAGGIIQLYTYWLDNNQGTDLEDLLTVFDHSDNPIWQQLH